MTWLETRTKVRRFLRDPSGNIWSNAFLLRIWNAEQSKFRNQFGLIEDAIALKSPPDFGYSYSFDWEAAFVSGDTWKWTFDYDPDNMVTAFRWESEVIEGTSAVGTSGTMFTHPWEAYAVSSPGRPSPFHAPDSFEEIIFAAFDRNPLDATTFREVMDDDSSWETHSGEPQKYYRDGSTTDLLYLWPMLSLSDWNDEYSDEGEPDTAEYQSTAIDIDDNLLMVVKKAPTDLAADGDESDYPAYLLKYINHRALVAAYSTNTDGRIESLRDYWQYRADIDEKIIQRFKINRMIDREYQLGPPRITRNKRHMQLPDHYPVVHP